jgi:phosphoserine phosphatase
MRNNRWRLASFDLDGTLVRNTTTCQHLGDCFGHGAVIRELERQYAQGTMTNRQVAEIDGKHYAGRRIDEIDKAMRTIALIDGIDETFSILRRQEIHIILATLTWSFAAKLVAERFKLDAWSGCVMGESAPEILSGTVLKHFDEFSKRAFVEEYCAKHDIPMDQVFAVGDSRADIPMFSAVGHSVAVNATEAAKQAASCAMETQNLREVLKVIPGIDEAEGKRE